MVSSAQCFAGLTTPSAALRWLRDFRLMPHPPLLCEGNNVLGNSPEQEYGRNGVTGRKISERRSGLLFLSLVSFGLSPASAVSFPLPQVLAARPKPF